MTFSQNEDEYSTEFMERQKSYSLIQYLQENVQRDAFLNKRLECVDHAFTAMMALETPRIPKTAVSVQ